MSCVAFESDAAVPGPLSSGTRPGQRYEMYRARKVAVVVPAFNEQAHIEATLRGIPPFVDAVYVVDDGSTDGTAEIVQATIAARGAMASPISSPYAVREPEPTLSYSAHTSYASGEAGSRGRPSIILIQHERNQGVGAAIMTGYRRSLFDGADVTAVMAGDNQMEPEWMPALLDPVVDGLADYAKGTRQTRVAHLRGMSPWRILGNLVLRVLTTIASGNPHITDPQHGYTAISREALKGLELDSVYPYYGYSNDLVARLSVLRRRIVEVPMPSMYHGEVSKIQYRQYIPRVFGLLLRLFLLRITGRLGNPSRSASTSIREGLRI